MERYTYRDARGECWYSGGTEADHLHRLTEYEDVEEQGLLVRLPCKEEQAKQASDTPPQPEIKS